MFETVKKNAEDAVNELLEKAKLRRGDIFVVGCSSSEVSGKDIGSFSSPEAARAVFDGLYPALCREGLFLAAQCCEHLNRSLVVEREAAEKYDLEIVNAVPQPKAGGSFATAAWKSFKDPVLVSAVRARAGMDIGCTLIGMHLAPVAVPVRLAVRTIGEAPIVCARTRPRYVGGERAVYDPRLA